MTQDTEAATTPTAYDRLQGQYNEAIDLCKSYRNQVRELTDLFERQIVEASRLRSIITTQSHTIEQTLGKALGYPRFADDPVNFPGASDSDCVCVGEHVAETLAAEAARRIGELAAEVERLRAELKSAVTATGQPIITQLGETLWRVEWETTYPHHASFYGPEAEQEAKRFAAALETNE